MALNNNNNPVLKELNGRLQQLQENGCLDVWPQLYSASPYYSTPTLLLIFLRHLPIPSRRCRPPPLLPSTFNNLGPDCNTIAKGDLSQTSVSANIDQPHVQYLGELLHRCANAYNGRNFIFTILNDNAEIRRYTPDTTTLQTNLSTLSYLCRTHRA